ncbi:camp-binding domain-like protein [Caulochytrium protostelioides]|nr:camp-binding domain-like protein [Caulochytrium protostelioides]
MFFEGDSIVRKDDVGREMYFLIRGCVEVVSRDGATRFSLIRSGSFFGEMGVLFDVPRTASVRALGHCFCSVLTRDALDATLQSYPCIAARFRQVVEARLDHINKQRQESKRIGYSKQKKPVPIPMASVSEESEEHTETLPVAPLARDAGRPPVVPGRGPS